jgi:arsenate reductase-like glutaredoxin family protein
LRFFSDRRIPVAFVDLARKPIAAGELKRFSQKFGVHALFDTESTQYREAGLGYLSMDDDAAFDRLLADDRLILLPLVRAGTNLSIGVDEKTWRGWLAAQG